MTIDLVHPSTSPLLGATEAELAETLASAGEPKYRARQILDWIYRKGCTSFDEMSNLSKTLRAKLAERFHIIESQVAADQVSQDGTRKLLLRWADGQTTECVLIPDEKRRTVCVSTQVGCPVGCVFCASGLNGVQRNLSAGQIVEQALRAAAMCDEDAPLSNVVFMGLGEPLANYDNTVRSLRTINADWGMNIGARKITVSTVGLPKQMRRLADEKLQITLALSLHAPTDELRAELVPWADRVPIADLVEAANYYFAQTGREVTIEYVLLAGVNDSPKLAAQLASLCRKMRANVNLIRYNEVTGVPYRRPTAESAQTFLETLRDRHVNAHLRKSRGQDIEGACGQLRRRYAATD